MNCLIILQNNRHGGQHNDERAREEHKCLPQALLLHNAGQPAPRQLDCAGSHESRLEFEARPKRQQGPEGRSHSRDPRDSGTRRAQEDHDLEPQRGTEEATQHRPGASQQSAHHVLRRAHQVNNNQLLY